jgi:hypothetical protein
MPEMQLGCLDLGSISERELQGCLPLEEAPERQMLGLGTLMDASSSLTVDAMGWPALALQNQKPPKAKRPSGSQALGSVLRPSLHRTIIIVSPLYAMVLSSTVVYHI